MLLIYRDILEARIRLDLEIFWPIVARSKNLLARGSLSSKIYWPGLDPALSEIHAAEAAVSAFGCQLKRCHLTVKRVNWAKPNKGISTKEGVCVTRFYALFKRNGPPFDTRTHFSTWQRGTNPFIVGSKISPYKYTYNAYNRFLKST